MQEADESHMKVLVVDGYCVSRIGLKELLSRLDERLSVTECASCGQALESLAREDGFDLAFLDIHMSGEPPFKALEALRTAAPAVPLIVFSEDRQRHSVMRAIELGAMGYIPKTMSEDDVLAALRLVMAGSIFFPRALLERRAGGAPDHGAALEAGHGLQGETLTPRQREVLALLSEGLSNRSIANRLNVSEHTVRIHISAILKTMHLSNRTQAAVTAAAWLARDRLPQAQ